MTITTTNNRVNQLADGVQTTFPFDFLVQDASHMRVYEDGVITTKSYTINGIGDPAGGNVVFSPTVPANGVTVTLQRVVPLTQQVDYRPFDAFPAETHEGALDKLTQITQQNADEVERSLKGGVATPPGTSYELPFPVRNRGLYWEDDATPTRIVNGPTVAEVEADKNAAEAAASAAQASAGNAATSASNAGNSASAASTSETNAANSAAAASTSETNAANSANAASTSETNAQNSANAALSVAVFDIATYLVGLVPAAGGSKVMQYECVRNLKVEQSNPAYAVSKARLGTASTTAFNLSITKNGTAVGSIAFGIGVDEADVTWNADFTLVAGDNLDIEVADAANDARDLAVTLALQPSAA